MSDLEFGMACAIAYDAETRPETVTLEEASDALVFLENYEGPEVEIVEDCEDMLRAFLELDESDE